MTKEIDESLQHLGALGTKLDAPAEPSAVTAEELAGLEATVAGSHSPVTADSVTDALHQLDRQQAADATVLGDRIVDLGRIERQVGSEFPGLQEDDSRFEEALNQLRVEAGKDGSAAGANEGLLLVAQSLNVRQQQTLSHLNTLLWTVRPFRWIGWLFLVLSAMDLAGLLIDLEFMNPASELKVIEGLIDRIPIPLLGIAFAFWGGGFQRTALELLLLKGLTWVSLVLGVLLLALAPLALVDGNRLDAARVASLQAEQQQLSAGTSQIEARLEAVGSAEAMQGLLQQISGRPVRVGPDVSLDQVRAVAVQQIAQARAAKENQIDEALTTGRAKYWMTTLKWSLGALLSGIIFIMVWRMTRWVRLIDERTLYPSMNKAINRNSPA